MQEGLAGKMLGTWRTACPRGAGRAGGPGSSGHWGREPAHPDRVFQPASLWTKSSNHKGQPGGWGQGGDSTLRPLLIQRGHLWLERRLSLL